MNESTRVTIEWQCEQLLRHATQLMDNADWTAYIECFTRDAILARPSDPDNPIVGRDAILASLHKRPPRLTCHILANSVFIIVNNSLVHAASRVLLLSGDHTDARPAPAHNKILVGTFNDELVLIDGQWKIAKRHGSIELSLNTDGD